MIGDRCIKCNKIIHRKNSSITGYLNKEHLEKTGERLFDVCSKCFDNYKLR